YLSRLLAIEDQCINLMFVITGLRLPLRQDDEQPYRDYNSEIKRLDEKLKNECKIIEAEKICDTVNENAKETHVKAVAILDENVNVDNTDVETRNIIQGQKKRIARTKKVRSLKSEERASSPPELVSIHVERTICEWFTLDTLKYLLGEKIVNDVLVAKGKTVTVESFGVDNGAIDRLLERLDHMGVQEGIADSHDEKEIEAVKEPLPSLEHLQKETREDIAKVYALLRGKMVIERPDNDQVQKVRIVAIKPKLVIPDLLRTLDFGDPNIDAELRDLLSTFNTEYCAWARSLELDRVGLIILVAGIAILLFFVVSIAHIIGIPFWWDRSPLATIIIISIGYWLLINVLFHYTMAVRTDPGHPDNLVESHAIENQAPRPRNWRRSAIVFEALITVAVFLALGALTLWHTRLITRNETSIEALENSDVRNKMKESGK
ncbi:hypothetical protein QYM36_011591, partial [Artemia franciscana]